MSAKPIFPIDSIAYWQSSRRSMNSSLSNTNRKQISRPTTSRESSIMRQQHNPLTSSISTFNQIKTLVFVSLTMLVVHQILVEHFVPTTARHHVQLAEIFVLHANGHVVIAKDDHGQHLVLTGEDGKKGKGGDGDQLVISGSQMGNDGQDSNMVVQDAANREGDIVMSGKSWVVPGEDGHIVLADTRDQNRRQHSQPPFINPLIFWAPYMSNRIRSNVLNMSLSYPYPMRGHIDGHGNSQSSGFGYHQTGQNFPRFIWSMITYHEYDKTFGDKFLSIYSNVSVDGFTNPMSDTRYCLGAISNCNRDLLAKWIRRRIGKGVQLIDEGGDVSLENFSSVSIFVNDPLMLWQDKGVSPEHVMKLNPGERIKIFSYGAFSNLLSQAFRQGYDAVFDMADRCMVRASFAKGWGPDYRGQLITQTPCWFEIQMIGPLQWVDDALRQSKVPQTLISEPSTWPDPALRQ